MTYQKALNVHLALYKESVLRIPESGTFSFRGRDVTHRHILPPGQEWSNILEPVRSLLRAYLDARRPSIKLHRYFHHLNSSQAFAFNLFVPYCLGPDGSSATLLRALRQTGTIRDGGLDFEVIPDAAENSNIDVAWRKTDGATTLCEVKLSEAEFGPAASDDRHREKLARIYRPVLADLVAPDLLVDKKFFRHYQILRNLWHIAPGGSTPGGTLIFLLPRANVKPWSQLEAVLALVSPALMQRTSVVAIEDVIAALCADSESPPALTRTANLLREKYLPH